MRVSWSTAKWSQMCLISFFMNAHAGVIDDSILFICSKRLCSFKLYDFFVVSSFRSSDHLKSIDVCYTYLSVFKHKFEAVLNIM